VSLYEDLIEIKYVPIAKKGTERTGGREPWTVGVKVLKKSKKNPMKELDESEI
jgi:hypothetical protein